MEKLERALLEHWKELDPEERREEIATVLHAIAVLNDDLLTRPAPIIWTHGPRFDLN